MEMRVSVDEDFVSLICSFLCSLFSSFIYFFSSFFFLGWIRDDDAGEMTKCRFHVKWRAQAVGELELQSW